MYALICVRACVCVCVCVSRMCVRGVHDGRACVREVVVRVAFCVCEMFVMAGEMGLRSESGCQVQS